jgi:hypothetical protein
MTSSKKRRGRKPWKPTKAARKRVETAAGMGLTPAEIARLERVDVRTLQKHCRDELTASPLRANAAVALALWKAATGANGGRPNARAAAFWLRTRGGWTEAKPAAEDEPKGVKHRRQKAARKVASSGRFAPGQPPKLALAVDNTKPRSTGSDDEPSS